MKPVLLALVLAAGIALGADVFVFSGQPSTPAANAGAVDATLAAQAIAAPVSSGCYVPGDLIGDANPAAIRCALGEP